MLLLATDIKILIYLCRQDVIKNVLKKADSGQLMCDANKTISDTLTTKVAQVFHQQGGILVSGQEKLSKQIIRKTVK